MAHILYMISLRERGSYAFQLALSEMEPLEKGPESLNYLGEGGVWGREGAENFHRLLYTYFFFRLCSKLQTKINVYIIAQP